MKSAARIPFPATRPGAPAVTTACGRGDPEPAKAVPLAGGGTGGFEVRPDLLASAGCQADAPNGDASVGEAAPAPVLSVTALVTGTTVRIWAVTPFMIVVMVVGTVTTVKVVETAPGFPWSPSGPADWVGVPPCLLSLPSCWVSLPPAVSTPGTEVLSRPGRTVVLTGMAVVIGRLLTGQFTAPGGHLVSVYMDVESAPG